jgi:hypothetical protein
METITLFEQIFAEDVPLLARLFYEQGMNVRHLLPDFMTWAKDNKDRKFLDYILRRSTIADVKDWLRNYHESRKKPHPSGKLRKIVNEWMYQLPPDLLQFWYGKYGDSFIEVFKLTRPRPDRWKLPWFQEACYGGEVPGDSLIAQLRGIRKGKMGDLATHLRNGIHWHYLRQTWNVEENLAIYVEHAPLRFVIERLGLYVNDPILVEVAIRRLEGTPRLNVSVVLKAIEDHLSPTGSLVNNLRYNREMFPGLGPSSKGFHVLEHEPEESELLKKIVTKMHSEGIMTLEFSAWLEARGRAETAQRRLRMKLIDTAQRVLTKGFLDTKHIGRTAILIDKSSSMDTAIDLGITVAGLIAAKLRREDTESDVKMLFFDSPNSYDGGAGIYPEEPPKDVLDMIALRNKWDASGGTTISGSLDWLATTGPFDTIFVVSDGNIWDFAEKTILKSGLRRWGASPEHMESVQSLMTQVPSANWIFVKMRCEPRYDAEVNPLGRLLEDDSFQGRAVMYQPRGAEDAETILGIASYFANHGLMSAVKRVRQDIIDYADTPKYKRQQYVPRIAIVCPRCNASTPPEINHCVYCGEEMAPISKKEE